MRNKKDDFLIFSETQDGNDDGQMKLDQLEVLWDELPEDLGETERSSFIEVMSRLVKYYKKTSSDINNQN